MADAAEACRLARQARRVAHDQFRLAECFEIMTQWRAMAEERNDRAAVDEATRELVWILEGWGLTAEARQLEQTRAMEFDEHMQVSTSYGKDNEVALTLMMPVARGGGTVGFTFLLSFVGFQAVRDVRRRRQAPP